MGNFVVALKLLLFLGKWTHAYQTCTPWSPGRSASRMCSSSRSRSKVTIWGKFTCSKCCSHLVHSFIRHSLLGHVCRLPPDVPARNIIQYCVNLSQGRCPAPTGSVHLVGQGRPGYNRWKRITGAQSTRCGHRRRITRCGGR